MAHVSTLTRGAPARWLACSAFAVAVLFASPGARAESTLDDFSPLTVRVYDLGGVRRESLGMALGNARAIFADAGIPSAWHDCTRGTGTMAPGCQERRHTSDLIVRLLRRGHDARGLPTALGASIVEASARRGGLATVYLDLVEPVAHRSGTDVPTLLGRAIAHEVGHLLLGTNGHSATGLMRETWTDRELGRNDLRDWLFDAADRGQLREARVRGARQARASESPAPPEPSITHVGDTR